ncbi:MAG: hypothetical protein ACRDQ4_09965 [Pseudonocardiaceae bacterium]
MTTNMELGLLLFGGIGGWAGGWVVARWWAEYRRAKFDQERIWKARKNYRKGFGSLPPPTL